VTLFFAVTPPVFIGAGTWHPLCFASWTEVITTIKKNALSSKKTTNETEKQLRKLTAPKGEKVSSMKGSDFTITKVVDKSSAK
jgi:hypothetical protein